MPLTSSATRAATVMAAMRRGCVHTTSRPPVVHPASCKYCGSWVVLPLPVSPTTTTVRNCSSANSKLSRHLAIGKRCRCAARGSCRLGLGTATAKSPSNEGASSPGRHIF